MMSLICSVAGISTYGSSPDSVMSYLTPLLDHASLYVPVSQHSQTPLYIMATAGMRLLTMRWVTRKFHSYTTQVHMSLRHYVSNTCSK